MTNKVKYLPILRLRKIWYAFSLVMIAASIVLVATQGLRLGIDFVGGTLHEINFTTNRPDTTAVAEAVKDLVGEATIQPVKEASTVLRYRNIDNETRQKVLDVLTEKFGAVEETSFESIGPTIGQELKRKAIWALVLLMGGIIVYITYAFRKVSEPVKSWKYGVLTVVTLLHDVSLVVGTYALLGMLKGAEANSLFLVALLTTLGYSVHDTIVVYDRTRTNLLVLGPEKFEKAVDLATNQTLTRSINTSLTAAITLGALLMFGGPTLFDFVLGLLVGVVVGTYSSIFVASPLLVTWHRFSEKRRARQ